MDVLLVVLIIMCMVVLTICLFKISLFSDD